MLPIGPTLVFGGKQRRFSRRERPGNRERWVIPAQTPLTPRRVAGIDLVEHIGHLGEHQKAVREASGHPQLFVVLIIEQESARVTEARGVATQVNDHIKNRPTQHPHQFPLGVRGGLEVQAAQGAAARARVVQLRERGNSEGGCGIGTPPFKKKPARVTMRLQTQTQSAR